METKTRGGAPRAFEDPKLTKANRDSNGETPLKGKRRNLAFNPCFVILGLHTLPKHDFFCARARCKVAEEKQPNSTKLVLVKKWTMKGRGGNQTTSAIFECPKCGKRTRKYNIGGSK